MTRYVLVGDSQAVGLRQPLRDALARYGWQDVGAAVHVGWGTGQMLASGEASRLVRAQRPDVALVILGGNDTDSGTYPDKVRQLAAQLAPARVIWVGPAHAAPLTIAARKAAVAKAQQRAAAVAGFRWIDARPMTSDLEHAPDGLHFTRAALEVWAARLAPVVTGARVGWAAGLVAGMLIAAGIAGVAVWARR